MQWEYRVSVINGGSRGSSQGLYRLLTRKDRPKRDKLSSVCIEVRFSRRSFDANSKLATATATATATGIS